MSRLIVVLVAVELIVVMALGWFLGPGLEDRFVPGVWVWEVPLGGMSLDQAAQELDASLPLRDPRIVLAGPDGQRWSFSAADMGMSVDVASTLAQAYEMGHTNQGAEALGERLSLILNGARVPPILTWERAAALETLARVAQEIDLEPQDATVRLEGADVVLLPGRTGRRFEITPTLESLIPYLYALEPMEAAIRVTDLPPSVSDSQAQQALSMAEAILAEPLTLLVPDPLEGDPGPWQVSPDVLARMITIRLDGDGVSVDLDEAQLAEYLGPLAMALYREPVDATFDFDPEVVELVILTSSVTGREMDVAASVAKVNEALDTGQHLVPLVINELQPAVPDSLTAEDLGVRELVAVGESYFTGSSSARDSNIRLGASKFDGVVVPPGEIFSFNEHLGDVTPEAGYDESYVIIGNRTVPGVGGGICQVATTAFRAAYFGGYPIVERWPHAYRVGYYELGGFGPGFDATIYSPLVDFRFKNDTLYHVIIHTEVDTARARLRFLFYSTDTGRRVEQIGPEWGDPIPAGAPVYEYDPSMPAGSVKQIESSHSGLDATLGRTVYDPEGTLLYEDEFVSKFIPWPARFVYGSGYVPPANAEVVSTPEP
jgi:vancomycin resistance protein YoaR